MPEDRTARPQPDLRSGLPVARVPRIRFVSADLPVIRAILARMCAVAGEVRFSWEVVAPVESRAPRLHDRLLRGVLQVERRVFRSGPARVESGAPGESAPAEKPDIIAYVGCPVPARDTTAAPDSPVVLEVQWPGGQTPVWSAVAAIAARADSLGFAWRLPGAGDAPIEGAVRVRTTRRVSETAERSLGKAVALCVDLAQKLVAGRRCTGWCSARGESAAPSGKASVALLVRYAVSLAWREVAVKLRSRLRAPQEWHLILRRGSLGKPGGEAEHRVPNPPGRFLADPFVVSTVGGDFVFAEDYVYAARAGRISAFRIDPHGALVDLGCVVGEQVHLSFPFVFEFAGQHYMCPETFGYGEIRLYRCDDFPLGWVHLATLLRGVSAADTMIFAHQGRWWLLTNMDSAGGNDHCTELHVYSSADPLGAHWEPHPMNPVVADSRCGRNGGLLVEGGRIFRLAQVQAFDSYGESLVVREIVVLSGAEYRERDAPQPANLVDTHLRHHASSSANWTASDKRTW